MPVLLAPIVLALLACTAPEPLEPKPQDTAPVVDTGPPPGEVTTLTTPMQPPLELCINEVMAANTFSYTDETGANPDWIELHNPGPVDVSLGDWYLSDDATDPFDHALSAELVVPAGGFLVLLADGLPDLGPTHLPFRLAVDGEELALFRWDGSGEILRFGALADDLALARSTDCCPDVAACSGFVWGGTPGVTNVEPVLVEEELLARGSTWRWRADAEPPPPDWTSPAFDDLAWQQGPGPLGYGDAHVVTTVPWGPNDGAKWLAYQFRHLFEVSDPASVDALWLDLARDDGAVVYLNGVEVARSNLPAGALAPETVALVAIGNADESAYQRLSAPADALVEGTNVLAVEVRQHSGSSTDLTFDLGVVVERVE